MDWLCSNWNKSSKKRLKIIRKMLNNKPINYKNKLKDLKKKTKH